MCSFFTDVFPAHPSTAQIPHDLEGSYLRCFLPSNPSSCCACLTPRVVSRRQPTACLPFFRPELFRPSRWRREDTYDTRRGPCDVFPPASSASTSRVSTSRPGAFLQEKVAASGGSRRPVMKWPSGVLLSAMTLGFGNIATLVTLAATVSNIECLLHIPYRIMGRLGAPCSVYESADCRNGCHECPDMSVLIERLHLQSTGERCSHVSSATHLLVNTTAFVGTMLGCSLTWVSNAAPSRSSLRPSPVVWRRHGMVFLLNPSRDATVASARSCENLQLQMEGWL